MLNGNSEDGVRVTGLQFELDSFTRPTISITFNRNDQLGNVKFEPFCILYWPAHDQL